MQTPVFVRTHDFLLWLLPHTAKFPKAQRHTVTNRLECAALDLQGSLALANRRRGAERLHALDEADEIHAKPVIIIARTTKGQGVSFMEYDHQWHGKPPTTEQFEAALAELEEGVARWQN